MDTDERKAREARASEGDDSRGGSFAPLLLILAGAVGAAMLVRWLSG